MISFGKRFVTLSLFLTIHLSALVSDPLPSWNETPNKKAILEYVQRVTEKDAKDFIQPEDRIAVFDQDGTLWVEMPFYTQMAFAIDRIKSLYKDHPEWKTQEPFAAFINDDKEAIANLSEADIEKIVAVTHSGMSVREFEELVKTWLKTAVHPRFKKPYTELVYQPMLEVLKFFEENGFTNYIVSGGGQEFIRAYAKAVYAIPPERVIGTAGKVKYEYREGNPELIKLPEILFVNDKQGKPEGINLIIGKRPVAAFGNSIGDREMLEWTQAGKGLRFELLVHHDDAEREYDYGSKSKIGTFSVSLMDEAVQQKWHVVSMKDDWKVIFPNSNL